jgi:plastocyanin domain-containing protein
MKHKIASLFLAVCFLAAPAAAQKNRKKAAGETLPTVTVKVSSAGYTPEEIRLRKGQKTRLVFVRTDTQNCGDEIFIPKYEVRLKLPLNQKVSVTLTPEETGSFKFTCGMQMMRGKIIVE